MKATLQFAGQGPCMGNSGRDPSNLEVIAAIRRPDRHKGTAGRNIFFARSCLQCAANPG